MELPGDARRTFPTVERILDVGEEGLEKLGLGLDKHAKIIAVAGKSAAASWTCPTCRSRRWPMPRPECD